MSGLAARIAEYSYKPGWTLDVCLRIRAAVTDSNDPEKPFTVESRAVVTPDVEAMDDTSFGEWISRKIRVVEDHERHEWLRHRGQPVRDPHAPKETT